MKRTNLKVRCKDGCAWVVRTVYEQDGKHHIKHDGRYHEIYQGRFGSYKAGLYNRIEYIED